MSTRREFLTRSAAAAAGLAAVAGPAAASPAGNAARAAPAAPENSFCTYRIPHTDLTVSRMAYGCAMLGIDWESPDFVSTTIPLIRVAHEQGITFFDLANVYGHGKAETALGQVLAQTKGLRNKIVIQSKCGDRFSDGTGDACIDNSRDHILESVEGSLQRLGTDRLDILLLHWPDGLVQPDEVAEAFERLHRAGKVRYFGVSNHRPQQIEVLRKSVRQPLVANQIRLGLGYWDIAPEHVVPGFTHGAEGASTLDYCRAHDMQVQAYSPLRALAYPRIQVSLLKVADDVAPSVKAAVRVLADMAAKHDAAPAAVMLAWLLRHPAGIVPIIGALKPEHIVENCTADRIELSREDWYTLFNAAAAMQLPPKAA